MVERNISEQDIREAGAPAEVICHVCGHKAAKSELVSEVFNLEGSRVLVENIPALVCEHCGEAACSRETTEVVLAAPAQKMPEHGNVVCYQSKVEMNKKPYLLRVMVNERATPPKVVTVYRTSHYRSNVPRR